MSRAALLAVATHNGNIFNQEVELLRPLIESHPDLARNLVPLNQQIDGVVLCLRAATLDQ